MELSSALVNQNNQLNTQRFGGSLCNVLPSKEFYHKNGKPIKISRAFTWTQFFKDSMWSKYNVM